MGFLQRIIGGAFGETVKGVSEGITGLASGIRSAITGELPPKQRAELEKLAQEADSLAMQGQLAINKIEAGHHSIFVSGWRPFIGWVCGAALAYNYLFHPLISWAAFVFVDNFDAEKLPPTLNMATLMPLIVGLLGLGVYRTVEKIKGAQRNH